MGTEVLVGGALLERHVSWATALRLRGGFHDLEPGALALVSLDTLSQMPARPTLAHVIEALAAREAAAIAIRGQIEPYQVPFTYRLAERSRCALLRLPPGKPGTPSVIEESVNTYLATLRSAA